MSAESDSAAAEAALLAAMDKPERIKGDAGEAEYPSLVDRMKLADRFAAKAAARRGPRYTKIIPPGAD